MRTNQGSQQLHALGDPSRRAIVEVLAHEGPLSVARLAERMPISRPAVSQHLRVLKDAHLVSDTSQGTHRIYSLDATGLADLRAYFTAYWQTDLEDFAEHVRRSTDGQVPS